MTGRRTARYNGGDLYRCARPGVSMTTSALVGRDRPQQVLRTWLAARTGDPGQGPVAMFVRGEAGIGKTALIRAVTKRRELLVRWAAAAPGPRFPTASSTRCCPGWWTPCRLGRGRGIRPGTWQALLAVGTPLTLVLEDLHWADEASCGAAARAVRCARR